MRDNMKSARPFIVTATMVAFFTALSGNVAAKPDMPLNAATVETKCDRETIGCAVCEVEDGYYLVDLTCKSFLLIKRDRDGNSVSMRYHDEREIQADQEAPSRTLILPFSLDSCEDTELITKSGRYRSSISCIF